MSNWIYGEGPQNAKLMVVGEAPGKTESERGRPFVGMSGEIVMELLEGIGLNRSQVYITNVVKVRPPDNKLDKLSEIGHSIDDFLPLLFKEIEAVNPNCILALGNLALTALTGETGISYWRGAVLPCKNHNSKVIGTLHPASLLHGAEDGGMFSWKQKRIIEYDFARAKRELEFKEIRRPRRQLRVIRKSWDFELFLNSYRDYKKVYVDTEIFKGHLVCIGFAFTPFEGISIPLIDLQSDENLRGIPMYEMVELWRLVAEVLANDEITKIGQNFKGDMIYWLEPFGFVVKGFRWDTMLKMSTCAPELRKSLAFQASILTDEPPWKAEGKEYNPFKDKIDDLCMYNAKDCVVNAECDIELDDWLKELGLEDFFYNFVCKASPIYHAIERRGLNIDKMMRLWLSYKYGQEIIEKDKEAFDLIGLDSPINVNSPKKVEWLLYDHLRLKRYKDTKDDTLGALLGFVKDERKRKIVQSIRDRRTLRKLKSTYIDAKLDFDYRLRCSYNQVGTETGRTSTSIIESPQRPSSFGSPFQTIPRGEIRKLIIPDPGKIFMEIDQSQAEARIVALLAKDYFLFELLNRIDVHRWTASWVYNVTELMSFDLTTTVNDKEFTRIAKELINDEQRQIGKSARHGMAYDEQPRTLAIKSGISLYRAKVAFDAVHKMSPNIKEVYHEGIQDALANNGKVLWTPFGRRREFLEKWSPKLFREAYAHIPQSTISDNTKRAMIAIAEVDWIDIMQEGHDSLLLQFDEGREREAWDIGKDAFEREIDFSRCSLAREPIIIPADCKVGYSWGSLEKFK